MNKFKLPVEVSILPNLLFCVSLVELSEDDILPTLELNSDVVVLTLELNAPILVDTLELNVLYPVVPVILT